MLQELNKCGEDECEAVSCYHCGEVVEEGDDYEAVVLGESRAMCCPGCREVARTIVEYGLEDFYLYRNTQSAKPDNLIPEELLKLSIYDEPEIQDSFTDVIKTDEDKQIKAVSLILEDVVCPACCWLIETQVSRLAGVDKISVNYSNHRAYLCWDTKSLALSDILKNIARIGYQAYPYDPQRGQNVFEQERKQQLRRIGLAGLLGMQVMMISIALYFGHWFGMEDKYRVFLHWVALILTTPVFFYSARPFFTRAWRDLSLLKVSMDVPVSLGILIAFVASIWSTLTGEGHVYFDSTVMFVFLLSAGRYFEFMARKQAAEHMDSLERIIPPTAIRLSKTTDGYTQEHVALNRIITGDRILVLPGETIPVDGLVVEGNSSVSEALMTGEGMPVTKHPGLSVIGGSQNIESPIHVQVEKTGKETALAKILKLIELGSLEKPRLSVLTNQIAAWFVLFVLFLAFGVAYYWSGVEGADWLSITIAVLMISCPCALSLATPTAMTAASSAMMRNGIAVIKANAIETLKQVDYFIFDKTGTLSEGELKVTELDCLSTIDKESCIAIAASIERFSEHPLAKGIVQHYQGSYHENVEQVKNYPGQGMAARLNGQDYFLGSPRFILRMTELEYTAPTTVEVNNKLVLLADSSSLLCVIYLSDELRSGVGQLICSIKQNGKKVALLSGDDEQRVEKIARSLDMDQYWGGQLPEQKLSCIQTLKENGNKVAMVGDGINDAPVMAASHLSIAIGSGTDLAKAQADMIVTSNQLESLDKALNISNATMKTIKQNLSWAIAYNFSALPLAAFAYIPPWVAALGMSLSSLIVVFNSARLSKY